MYLVVFPTDLKPEHRSCDPAKITFEMFSKNAQAAMRNAGSAICQFGGQRKNIVIPPK
jgi:hypothetical protein